MLSTKTLGDDFQLDALRATARSRMQFPPLSIDEQRTYQKWKRATFIVYGTIAFIIVAVLAAIDPVDTSLRNEMHSALAPSTASKAQH